MGHVRDNIHGFINHWWQKYTPDIESGQGKAIYRDGTFWAPSLPFRGTPGVNVGETDVELGERLVVHGEQKQSSDQDGHNDYTARSYSAFMRILPLPRAVDAEHAQAHYKNGVLRVTLPKTTRTKTRRVKVQVHG